MKHLKLFEIKLDENSTMKAKINPQIYRAHWLKLYINYDSLYKYDETLYKNINFINQVN